jgi:multidrug efflux system membrane fusion protein
MAAVMWGLVAAGALAGCKAKGEGAARASGPAGGGRRALKFPVEVQPVSPRVVEYAINAVGSIDAFETVQATARVQGVVERVRFREGEKVAAQAVLVEIEPQRYKLAVEAARAALEKSKAEEGAAKAGLQRREQAVATTPGLIPGEEIAIWRTRLLTTEADVAEKKAALAQADLNLHEAYVRAPVAGVIESRRVQTGQFAQPGTVLATLVQREPLLLRFNVPGPETAALNPRQICRFKLRDDRTIYEARITHVGHAADPATRMVTIVAEVIGSDRANLRPGAFAEVTVPIGDARAAPVLPQTAVRPTERGFVAYVVEKNVARERVLTLGMRTSDGAVEVKSGIRPGELAVVRGGEALRDGVPVEVSRTAPAPRADAESLMP